MAQTPRSTRREFLQGQAALDAVSHLAGDVASLPAAPVAAESCQLRVARRAMACTFEIFFDAARDAHGTEAAIAALDLVDALEDQLSVFREHSEISRLNRAAAEGPVAVERRLFELLAEAIDWHHLTQGAFDVTAGRLSETWGFKRRGGRLPTAVQVACALEAVGSQHVSLDAEAGTVEFLRSGLEINLGSIGKGYALDRAAEVLAAAGLDHCLLHGGQSSVLARGGHGHAPGGWIVGVRDPRVPKRRLGQLRLVNRALATSGSGTQFFEHEGKRFGHILDPRTGWPAEGVLTATALAPTAAAADALATAFYVMGPEQVKAFCREHADVSALLVCPGQRAGSLAIHAFGLAGDEWMLVEPETG
jgi:thiamine biosynthesis lipoprotein